VKRNDYGLLGACKSGKRAWRSFRQAQQAADKTVAPNDEPMFVYRCRMCGRYHLSKHSVAEYNRRQAEARADGENGEVA
jgi:hypothetical protein